MMNTLFPDTPDCAEIPLARFNWQNSWKSKATSDYRSAEGAPSDIKTDVSNWTFDSSAWPFLLHNGAHLASYL